MGNPKKFIDQDKATVERDVVSQIQSRIEQHLRDDGANFADHLGNCEVIMDGEGGVWCRRLGDGLQPTLQVFFDDGPMRWTAGYTLPTDQEIRPDAETGHYIADESGAFVRQLLDALDAAPVVGDEAIVLEPHRPNTMAQNATERFTDDLQDEQRAAARCLYNELEAILEPREGVKIGSWDCAMNEEETIILTRLGERAVLMLNGTDFFAGPIAQDWITMLVEIKAGIGAHLRREARDADRMSAARDIYSKIDGMLKPGQGIEIDRWQIAMDEPGLVVLRSGEEQLRLWLHDEVFGASPSNHDWISVLAELNAPERMAMREELVAGDLPDRAKMAVRIGQLITGSNGPLWALISVKSAFVNEFVRDFAGDEVQDLLAEVVDAIESLADRIVMKAELGSISLETIMASAAAGPAALELPMAAVGRRLYKLIVAAMDEGLIAGNGWGAEYRDSTCTTITIGDHDRPEESLSLDEDGSVLGTWLEGGDLLALAGRIANDLCESIPAVKVVFTKSVEEIGADLKAAFKATTAAAQDVKSAFKEMSNAAQRVYDFLVAVVPINDRVRIGRWGINRWDEKVNLSSGAGRDRGHMMALDGVVIITKGIDDFGALEKELRDATAAGNRENMSIQQELTQLRWPSVRESRHMDLMYKTGSWEIETTNKLDRDWLYTRDLKVIEIITNYFVGHKSGTPHALTLEAVFSDFEGLLEQGLLDDFIEVFRPALLAGWGAVLDMIRSIHASTTDDKSEDSRHIGFLFDRITSKADALEGLKWFAEDWNARGDARSQTSTVKILLLAFDRAVELALVEIRAQAEDRCDGYQGDLPTVEFGEEADHGK